LNGIAVLIRLTSMSIAHYEQEDAIRVHLRENGGRHIFPLARPF
jgi:hypothetical protein